MPSKAWNKAVRKAIRSGTVPRMISTPALQPWEQTVDEYLTYEMADPNSRKQAERLTRKRHIDWHRRVTAGAVRDGENVPVKVLAEYPDLISDNKEECILWRKEKPIQKR